MELLTYQEAKYILLKRIGASGLHVYISASQFYFSATNTKYNFFFTTKQLISAEKL